jgi:CYTH domain-containing protein
MNRGPAEGESAGKYARFEFERRFLVDYLPDTIARGRGWRITDRYIDNTHLRLRRMEPIGDGEAAYKLGQKHVPNPPDFARMRITNIYLQADEYHVFARLPAHELRKHRHLLEADGRTYSIDIFDGPLAGLVLAETGFTTSQDMIVRVHLPPWIAREVSDDVRFTGGTLAALTPVAAANLIQEFTGTSRRRGSG